jgi:hypothetical protein
VIAEAINGRYAALYAISCVFANSFDFIAVDIILQAGGSPVLCDSRAFTM